MAKLRYVWYDAATSEATEHARELSSFEAAIDSTVDFRAVSYQEIFRALQSTPEPRALWRSYMSERYFSDPGTVAAGRLDTSSPE